MQTEFILVRPFQAYIQSSSKHHLRFFFTRNSLTRCLLEQEKGLALDFNHKSLALVFTSQNEIRKVEGTLLKSLNVQVNST